MHAKSGLVRLLGELGQGVCCMHASMACLFACLLGEADDSDEVGVWD